MTTHTIDLSRYASTAAMNDLLDAEGRENPGKDRRTEDRADWYGVTRCKNLPAFTATVLARGDFATTERVRKAQRDAESLTVPLARSVRPALRHRRVTGQRFDLERVLDADPLPWSRWEPAPAIGSKIVSLLSPLGANAGVAAEDLAWSPVAGIVLADILENAGYRVEISACHSTIAGTRIEQQIFPLKRASDPLDINAVARVCHPAVFRGFLLPVSMVTSGIAVLGSSYGHHTEIDLSQINEPNTIAMRSAFGRSACLDEIRRVLKLFAEQ